MRAAITHCMKISRERKNELQAQVATLNNKPGNTNVDHLTFTEFFTTEEEFARHIAKLEENARDAQNAPRKRAKP